MTYAKLFGFGFILVAVLVVLKTVFFGFFTWEETALLHYIYWGVAAVLTPALVRRLGVITILEAIVVAVLWLVMEIIGDAIVAAPIAGWRVLVDPNFAIGYLIPPLVIFMFHKKRHVHVRKQLAAAK
ncbi:MAG: hypothetical protein JNK33_04870 [Candidatus Doudnabacteria bacterium]|nr:hypothetical protein [Candidatus Doudnabacteria bacterium]